MENGSLEDASDFLSHELFEITPEDVHGMSLSDRTKGILSK